MRTRQGQELTFALQHAPKMMEGAYIISDQTRRDLLSYLHEEQYQALGDRVAGLYLQDTPTALRSMDLELRSADRVWVWLLRKLNMEEQA